CRCQSSGRTSVRRVGVVTRVGGGVLDWRIIPVGTGFSARLVDRRGNSPGEIISAGLYALSSPMKFDDLAKLSAIASWRLPESDRDPQETHEWIDALDAVIAADGPARATFLLQKLVQHARRRRVQLPTVANTPYINTISLAQQTPFPGN